MALPPSRGQYSASDTTHKLQGVKGHVHCAHGGGREPGDEATQAQYVIYTLHHTYTTRGGGWLLVEPQESLECTPHYYVYASEYKDRQYTALACVYSTQLLYPGIVILSP